MFNAKRINHYIGTVERKQDMGGKAEAVSVHWEMGKGSTCKKENWKW
jgi:hypothetical protein